MRVSDFPGFLRHRGVQEADNAHLTHVLEGRTVPLYLCLLARIQGGGSVSDLLGHVENVPDRLIDCSS